MKLKNLIIAGMLSILPVSVCSAADVEVSFDWETTNVTVNANVGSDYADCKAMMYALVDGGNVGGFTDDTQQETNSNIMAIGYTEVTEDGDAVFSDFKVAGENGNYCFYVTVYGADRVFESEPIYIPTKTSLDDFLASMQNATAEDIRALLDAEAESKYLNIEIPIYDTLNDDAKEEATAALAERTYDSITTVMEEINKASVKPGIEFAESGYALAKLIYPDKYADTEKFAALINAENDMKENKKLSTFEVLVKLENSDIEAVLSEAIENDDNDDLIDSVNIAVINYEFANANGFGDITDILESHKDDALEEWNGFGVYNISSHRNALNKTLLEKRFTSTKELIDYIKDYLANPPKSNSSSSSSSSSSGGKGSGSKGSSTATIPTLVTGQSVATPREEEVKIKYPHNFADMENHSWADEAVSVLKEKGVIAGKSSVSFAPALNVTREEFIKMIVAAFEIHNAGAVSSFADVQSGAWYDSFIASAVEKGIVNGVSATEFGVGSLITRQDMAVMVARAKGANLQGTAVTGFADDAQVADYAKAAVKWMKDNKFVSGYEDGTFGPTRFCTRAEAAKIIYEAIK